MDIVCHIVGITNTTKSSFITTMQNIGYNIVDLDDLSNTILKSKDMIHMFKQYQTFKESKNDKFKEIDKKMSFFWDASMEEMILQYLTKDKKNILIGYSHNFRNINRRINVSPHNTPIARFIINVTKKDVKDIITYNLDKHRGDIINGAYPLDNIDFDFIYNNRLKIDAVYEKNGYLSKCIDTLYTILELNNNKIDCEGLWIALDQPYNISSKIYPKNNKLFAFTDKTMALLSSFNFNDDELEKTFENNVIRIKPKKANVLDRLNSKRYLHLVDKTSFVPHEKGNNIKYFSQEPVTVIDMIKIVNVNKYMDNKDIPAKCKSLSQTG